MMNPQNARALLIKEVFTEEYCCKQLGYRLRVFRFASRALRESEQDVVMPIKTLGDLSDCGERWFRRSPTFGPNSIALIKCVLSEHGLSLAGDD
jgi:hypothetical protein